LDRWIYLLLVLRCLSLQQEPNCPRKETSGISCALTVPTYLPPTYLTTCR
jgi:hypothetical protein